MCVAAVSETLITALNIYYNNTGDTKPFAELPASSWNGWSDLDIRTYMWENNGSHSAGYAFDKFGIGEKLDFTKLRPGDFLSFDRLSNSGHSVVFLGYIDQNYNVIATYSDKVAGFKYYSAQGSGVAGFAYRFAFFGGDHGKGVCSTDPKMHEGIYVDCFGGGVSWPYVVGRGGRVWQPSAWHVSQSIDQLRSELVATLEPALRQQYATQISELAKSLQNNGLQLN